MTTACIEIVTAGRWTTTDIQQEDIKVQSEPELRWCV